MRQKYARAGELLGYAGDAAHLKEVAGLGFVEATKRQCAIIPTCC
jgi:hypothetical protein